MSAVRIALAAGLLTLCAADAGAQRVMQYTEGNEGQQSLVYGLPVPMPVESLTPVDGFRSYASLQARLQALALASPDLAAHDVGRTHANRPVWAYVASDDDGVDVEGRPEAAFFINATTHAREWASPEVATGTLERLVAGAGDGGIVRYVLDNTRVVAIPVQNVDGFLQTQRYPTDVVLGADPEFPNDWPRDGRMRRKNMPNVDEVLLTFTDHLFGTDLNRNHPPLWATSADASPNPNSLTYRGSAPHGEPENLAIEEAAKLGPETRMRLGIDVHSFSRVFYSSNTGRTRLNQIQSKLIERLRTHHAVLSGGRNYRDVRDPPNRGIGAAAEYFAYTWKVPAWTLELEPATSAAEYGATSVTHSGFILPASQIRRVREAWAESHLLAFYMLAGPPHLARVRFVEVDGGRVAQQVRWRWDGASGKRVRERTGDAALRSGVRYRAELGFSKPMRFRNAGGLVAPVPGAEALPRTVDVVLAAAGGTQPLDTSAGQWLDDPARVLRYRDDTFAFEFVAPAELGSFALEVDASDATGLRIDADPQTAADWADGAWSAYDAAVGQPGDVGGVDRGTAGFDVAAATAAPVEIASVAPAVGEGDRLRVTLRRVGDAGDVLRAGRIGPMGLVETVEWDAGEAGDKTMHVSVPENTALDGTRQIGFELGYEHLHASPGMPTVLDVIRFGTAQSVLLDNDASDLRVLRSAAGGLAFDNALLFALGADGARALVLDNDGSSRPLPAHPLADMQPGTLALFGNHAELQLSANAQAGGLSHAFDVPADASLHVDAASVTAADDAVATGLVRGQGAIRIERSRLGPLHAAVPAIAADGPLDLRRSVIDNVWSGAERDGPAIAIGGDASFDAVAIAGPDGSRVAVADAGTLRSLSSTIAHNPPLVLQFDAERALALGNTLLQDNVHGPGPATPPPDWPHNCARAAVSLGFNLEDGGRCQLRGPADKVATLDLGALGPGLAGIAPVGSAINGGATRDRLADAGCNGVDVRGAPRPQSTNDGPESRCDVGAVELGVNPYRGIWAPTRSGHGLDLQTRGNVLMLAWYTYADDGQPTAYQAAAPLTGDRWDASLQWSRRDPATGVASVQTVGRVSLDFASDTEATLGWRFDARGTEGSETIRASLFDTGAPRFEVTGLWFPPAEANYGATITRRGETTAIGLYYYDAAGTIRWALGTGDAADVLDLAMTSYTGFCPDCDATQMPVTGTAAGTLRAHFLTPVRARLDLDLTYPRAAGGTWQRDAVRFEPLNDPVDNRAAAGDAR